MIKRLRTSAGALVQLGERIASSGEGEVFRTDRPDRLIKIYHAMDEARLRKLRAMVANPPSDPTLAQGHPSIAWPIDLVAEEGRPVGFVMPRIERAVSMNAIYNPRLRQRHAPGFNWYYLHVAALNVSWIVQAIHAKGYVIGDLKTDNLLVDPGTMVTIIDTDSFQVPDLAGGAVYRCPVGSEGFTPPELIGRDFAEVDRTEVHDRFGLAVIIHLLLAGYHPFNGMWEGQGEAPQRDELIRRGHWPHAETSKLKPGPAAIAPETFHPAVEECFRRAFDIGHVKPRGRPAARDWYHALRAAADDLVPCDANPAHLHAGRSVACPWCARAAGLGVDVFPAHPGADTQPVVLVKRFEQALARGEERRALDLWARHPELAELPYTRHHGKQVKLLVRMLGALDRFIEVLKRDPTNDDLLRRLWQGPPDLAACRSARTEKLGERAIAEIADEIGRRAAAVTRLREAVRGAGNPPDEAGEAAILAAHDGEPALFQTRLVRLQSLLARVDLARRRMERWGRLKAALEAGDDRATAEAWGIDGLLADFADAAPYLDRIQRAAPRAQAFEAFLAHWQQAPEDDDGIWALWSAEPNLGTVGPAQLACSAMGGAVPAERARLAGRRVADRQRLKAAATALPVDPRVVAEAWEAAAWDAARCQDHADIGPLWATIQGALDASARLDDLQALADSGDDAAIAAAWDETTLGAYALPAPLIGRVREAVAQAGFRGPCLAPLLASNAQSAPIADPAAVQIADDGLRLRWHWPDDAPPVAALAARADRFPIGPADVAHRGHGAVIERAAFLASGWARLDGVGSEVFVAVWPARLVGGAIVVPHDIPPIHLARARRLRLAYAIRRQWLRRGVARVKLTAASAFELPALLVYAADRAVPVPGAAGTRTICRIPPLSIKPGEPVAIELPALSEGAAVKATVRVYPERLDALAWLDIRHPAMDG
jgi:hypothetical protein